MGAAASAAVPLSAPTGAQIKHERNKLLLRNYLVHRGRVTVRQRLHSELAAGKSADGFVPLAAARAALRTVGCNLNYAQLRCVLQALDVATRELHESGSSSGSGAACGEDREREGGAEGAGHQSGPEYTLACDAVQLERAFDVSSHPPPGTRAREWIDALLQGQGRSRRLEKGREAGAEAGRARQSDQWTAAKVGDMGVLEQLTSLAQLLAPDTQGNTVMYHACHCGHARAVALIRARLVQHASSTQHTGTDGASAKTRGEPDKNVSARAVPAGKESLVVLEKRLGMRDGDMQRCFTNALNERTKRALIGEHGRSLNQEQEEDAASDGDDPGFMNLFCNEDNDDDY